MIKLEGITTSIAVNNFFKKPLDKHTFVCYIILMKDEKHYRLELSALGKKEATGRWGGFDEANAFFSTDAKPATAEFIKATEKAMDRTFEQQSRYWLDYTIGKLFVQDGWEKVSPMSPEWEYRTPTTMSHAVWKEVKEIA